MMQIMTDLFNHISFWVQVHGVPPGLLAKPYGERLGKELPNSMGEFLEFDQTYRRTFMRFRVRLDSSKPLLRGKLQDLNKLKTIFVFLLNMRDFPNCATIVRN